MKTIAKKACYEQPKTLVYEVKMENAVIITSNGDEEVSGDGETSGNGALLE